MGLAREEREAAARGEGCLGKAADDEPVFILRAQDVLAPRIVAHWADLAHQAGCGDDKVADAMRISDAMLAWQRQNHSKAPD